LIETVQSQALDVDFEHVRGGEEDGGSLLEWFVTAAIVVSGIISITSNIRRGDQLDPLYDIDVLPLALFLKGTKGVKDPLDDLSVRLRDGHHMSHHGKEQMQIALAMNVRWIVREIWDGIAPGGGRRRSSLFVAGSEAVAASRRVESVIAASFA
jgi:hypothetical protein